MSIAHALSPIIDADACIHTRAGVQACGSCAQVCPHQALSLTGHVPTIDASACQRCGACSAACPTSAIQRPWFPESELTALIREAVQTHPAIVIFACGHGAAIWPALDVARSSPSVRIVELPCVQLVSDDLLLSPLLAGVGAVLVAQAPTCPSRGGVGPARALASAMAVIEAADLGASRLGILPDDAAEARRMLRELVDASADARTFAIPSGPTEAPRWIRRAALLATMAPDAGMRQAAPVDPDVAWRAVEVDDRCTTCGACASLCHSAALAIGRDGATLVARDDRCTGCGACERGCPQGAIKLVPTIPIPGAVRVVAKGRLAACTSCAAPIGPEASIQEVERLLRRAGIDDVTAVRRCQDCKDAALELPTPAAARDAPGAARRRLAVVDDRVPSPSLGRRGFLGGLAAAFGAAAAATAVAEAAVAGKPGRKRRWGMVIDTRRCVGCRACVIACKAENKTPPGVNYMLVIENVFGKRPDDKPIFTAKPCFHCEHPPCVDVCPVSATFKRPQDGIVVVDYDRCIGCRYCQTACPYGARFFDFGENYGARVGDQSYASTVPSPEYGQFRERGDDASPVGNVRKCTFCLHLRDEQGAYDRASGRWPACAKTCTGHAIHFGDLNDPESEVSRLLQERQPVRLKEELGAEPNVYYLL